MKKIVYFLLIVILIFLVYLLFNTLNFKSTQVEVAPISKIEVPESALSRFQKALRIKTISFASESDFDSTQFALFNTFIEEEYPNVHQQLEHRIFNHYSHLYLWQGRITDLDPILLMAHHDVVPIAAPEKWTADPFAGSIEDGQIWGRGAMDDKFAVIGILEAAEMLITEGYQPERTIMFSFGHDEEIGGQGGAVAIADYLKTEGANFEFVLDEGMAISQGMIPNVDRDVAFIGTAEKGIVSIELTVSEEGGHSSQPARETSIDILAKAVYELKRHPLEGRLSETLTGFIDRIGPEMSFLARLVFANRKVFKPLIIKMYGEMSNSGNALVRTTTSPTIFQAGVKENVIPGSARAIVNFRIIPGQVAEEVMTHVNDVINDHRVKAIYYGPLTNPSPVSPSDTKGFGLIEKTIKEVHPGVLTSPNLVIGATDSRHFTELSKNIYRFSPFHIHEKNITCFHGVDERVLISDFENAVRFYHRLISTAGEDYK